MQTIFPKLFSNAFLFDKFLICNKALLIALQQLLAKSDSFEGTDCFMFLRSCKKSVGGSWNIRINYQPLSCWEYFSFYEIILAFCIFSQHHDCMSIWNHSSCRTHLFNSHCHDYTLAQQSWSGVYWFHLVRPSVRPSVDRIVSTLYLLQYSLDPFHIYKSDQATSEGVSRVKSFFFFFQN